MFFCCKIKTENNNYKQNIEPQKQYNKNKPSPPNQEMQSSDAVPLFDHVITKRVGGPDEGPL